MFAKSKKFGLFRPLPEKKEEFYLDEDNVVCRKSWIVITPETTDQLDENSDFPCTSRALKNKKL